MEEKKLVRIKPFNPALGHTTRRYMYRKKLFREDRGWVAVSAALAEELRMLQNPSGIAVAVFDVMSFEEAKRMHDLEEMNRRPVVERYTPEDAFKEVLSERGDIEEDIDEDPFGEAEKKAAPPKRGEAVDEPKKAAPKKAAAPPKRKSKAKKK